MSAIGKAFRSIGKGIGNAFKSVGQIAKGVLTLDLKGALGGVGGLMGALGSLHPASLAANTLMEGALNKLLRGPCVPKDLPAPPPVPQLPPPGQWTIKG